MQPLRHSVRIIVLLVVSATMSGCVNTMLGMVGESVGVPMDYKVVGSKLEPNTLVAMDGASCIVSAEAWEKAETGDRYFCAWSRAKG